MCEVRSSRIKNCLILLNLQKCLIKLNLIWDGVGGG